MEVRVYLIIFIPLILFSEIISDVVISTSSTEVKEIYSPKFKRNPMVKSSVKESVTKKYLVDISTATVDAYSVKNFSLNGIIRYNNNREALLKNNISGELFILRGDGFLRSLRDIKKTIKNIKGEIKGKSVILYNTQTKESKEFFINN